MKAGKQKEFIEAYMAGTCPVCKARKLKQRNKMRQWREKRRSKK